MKATGYGIVLALAVGLATVTAKAQTGANADPVGQCMLDLANKLAPSAATALGLAEYIADRCMELDTSQDCGVEPPVDAPNAAWGQWNICNRIHEDATAEKREITRQFAYKLIVQLRQGSTHH